MFITMDMRYQGLGVFIYCKFSGFLEHNFGMLNLGWTTLWECGFQTAAAIYSPSIPPSLSPSLPVSLPPSLTPSNLPPPSLSPGPSSPFLFFFKWRGLQDIFKDRVWLLWNTLKFPLKKTFKGSIGMPDFIMPNLGIQFPYVMQIKIS